MSETCFVSSSPPTCDLLAAHETRSLWHEFPNLETPQHHPDAGSGLIPVRGCRNDRSGVRPQRDRKVPPRRPRPHPAQPLLNFRPTKRRGIEVVDERSRELFRILVRGERVMYFLPAAEGQAPAAQAHTSPDAPDDPFDDIPPSSSRSSPNPPTTPTKRPRATPTTSSRPRSPWPR